MSKKRTPITKNIKAIKASSSSRGVDNTKIIPSMTKKDVIIIKTYKTNINHLFTKVNI